MQPNENTNQNNANNTPTTSSSPSTDSQGTAGTSSDAPPAVVPPVVPPADAPPAAKPGDAPPAADDKSILDKIREEAEKNKPATPPVEDKFEEYELELPDGHPLGDDFLDKTIALAEKHNWTKEESEAYIESHNGLYKKGTEDITKKAFEMIKAEQDKFQKDPDWNTPEKKVESLGIIDRLIVKHGDDDIREYMRGPGGNSLPLAKLLLRIGKLGEPESQMPGKSTGAGSQEYDQSREAMLKRQYPSFFQGQ